MSSSPLLVLHWGEVDRILNVSNVAPAGRVIKPIKGSDLGNKIADGSTVKGVGGGGSNRRISGSGRTNLLGGGGGGRICT